MVTSAFEVVKEQQLKEYTSKHGKLPPCMEQNSHEGD
jgi:hypothetical protein